MGKLTRWATGLKVGHREQLPFTEYDIASERIVSSRPIVTTLDSLYLGGQHRMSSAIENVFFKNLGSNTQWYPPWSGVKDQSLPENQGPSGLIAPSVRTYSSNLYAEERAGSLGTGVTPFDITFAFSDNISGYGIEVMTEEAIEEGDHLFFDLLDSEGQVVHEQVLKGVDVTIGSIIRWFFDSPLEVREGTVLQGTLQLVKRRRVGRKLPLLVNNTVEDPALPWVLLFFRTFKDVAIGPGRSEFSLSTAHDPELSTIHLEDYQLITDDDYRAYTEA